MPDESNRRRFARYLIHLPLLHKPKVPAPIKAGVGWTRNLSDGGTCVDLTERLQPGTPLRVRLQTDRGPIEVEAQVVWAGEPGAPGEAVPHGIVFDQVAPDEEKTLRDLLLSRGEKRHAGVRLPLDIPVTCQPKDQDGPSVEGRTGNMSRGGMLLRLSEAIPPQTVLKLTLHTPQGPVTAEGEIVWVDPPERRTPGEPIAHGLRFTVLGWSTSLSLGLFLVDQE